MRQKKSIRKKASKKKPPRAKTAPGPRAAARKEKPARTKAAARTRKSVRSKRRKKTHKPLGSASPAGSIAVPRRGLGAESAGQSGDTEGLSSTAHADSESVEELSEEGQAFEAEVVHGVEDAPDPDEAEVTTHEVPEDDVPEEYEDEQ